MSDTNRNARLNAELIDLMPALQKFARRFYSLQTDIDDLVQDTLVKALSNFDKFEEGTRLKSWMFTIMRNTFCSRFNVAKREHVGIDDAMAGKSRVQPHQEWSVRGVELEHAIAGLPKPSREAVHLVLVQGMSYEDAARQFGCPVGTVKSRVNRARERLVQQLDAD
jgi:RNA polymerase sigma-70 factor (ECF subfamily)